MEKSSLKSVGNTTMWLYCSLAGSEIKSLILKEQRQK